MCRLVVVLSLLVAAAAACAPKSDYTPPIAISPGVEWRLAMMDRYRLHDEERRAMMERPHVWVEGVPDDEQPDGGRDGADGADEETIRVEPGGLR